jgi:hypothetical protein
MRAVTFVIPVNYIDEYLRVGEGTSLKCIKKFAEDGDKGIQICVPKS